MVVKKKEAKDKPTFDQLEKQSREEIDTVKCKQQKSYAAMLSANNSAAFYFSIVFERQEERDEWCKKHGIILKDNEYILAKDYDIGIKKR